MILPRSQIFTEVDNVCFETWMPKRELPIPAIKPGIYTPIELGVRITNHTQSSLYFCFYNSLFAEVISMDGQRLCSAPNSDGIRRPNQSDFLQVRQGKALRFCFDSNISWFVTLKKKLRASAPLIFNINFDSYCRNECTMMPSAGTYQFQWKYHETRKAVEQFYKECGIEPSILEEVWIGEVVTPPVEFSLLTTK